MSYIYIYLSLTDLSSLDRPFYFQCFFLLLFLVCSCVLYGCFSPVCCSLSTLTAFPHLPFVVSVYLRPLFVRSVTPVLRPWSLSLCFSLRVRSLFLLLDFCYELLSYFILILLYSQYYIKLVSGHFGPLSPWHHHQWSLVKCLCGQGQGRTWTITKGFTRE